MKEDMTSQSNDAEKSENPQEDFTFFTGSYRDITSDGLQSASAQDDDTTRPIKVTAKNVTNTSTTSTQPRSFSSQGSQARSKARAAQSTTQASSSFTADSSSRHSVGNLVAPRWRIMYNATLVVLDMVMMLLSTVLILLVHHNAATAISKKMPGGVIAFVVVMCLSWLFSLVIVGSYRRHIMGEGYDLYAKIVLAALLEFVLLCCIAYIFRIEIPRWITFMAPLLAFAFTCIERWLMRRSLHRNRRNGEYTYPTVIVGSPEGIHRTISILNSKGRFMGYEPIAVCPIVAAYKESDPDAPQHLCEAKWTPQNELEANLRVMSMNSQMPQAARKMGAYAVLVTDVLTRDSETMRTLSLAVESLGMELVITVQVADIGAGRLTVRNNTAMPVLSASLPQYSVGTRFVKRVIDVVGSAIALIPASILMLIAAIAIKIEDGGPVLYKQERIGLYGKPFKILKMRSMRVNADKMDAQVAAAQGVEHGITFKLKDDPRVTKVGKVIRKTSIDELPQFINVLKGDMSLVGPRPQQRYEVDQYGALYSTRLLVRPGITGPWQISGRNDNTPEEAEYLDVNYVENWSLATDIAILLKTAVIVVKGNGAY